MPLTRRLRKSGHSLSLTIPGDFVAAMDLKAGDTMEFIPQGPGGFRIRKVLRLRPSVGSEAFSAEHPKEEVRT